MNIKTFVLSALAAGALILGCATIQPGNDPFIVRVEQTETMAAASFDTVIRLDNVNRTFWRTNAPEFHSFVEWLRATQAVSFRTRSTNSPTGYIAYTAIAPRSSAMVIELNEVKLDYRAGKASSNTLYGVYSALMSALNKASAWTAIVTNTPIQ